MVRAYSRYGSQAIRVVEITCNQNIEAEFLSWFRCGQIRLIDKEAASVVLLGDNPAAGQDKTA